MDSTLGTELPHQDLHVLLQGVVGSNAYHLNHDGSDVDYLGVFLAPTIEVLGMRAHTITTQSFTSSDPDSTVHELGKFVSLALRCNPTILELLFLPEYVVCTPSGRALIDARASFLSEPAVRAAYGGFATAQAKKISFKEASARTKKHARHCARLLLQGSELLTTGTITMDVSKHRDQLFALGELAVMNPLKFKEHFEGALATFEQLPSTLPAEPDHTRIEDLVRSIRLGALIRR
jgi:predicted nucleotidyltransferase